MSGVFQCTEGVAFTLRAVLPSALAFRNGRYFAMTDILE